MHYQLLNDYVLTQPPADFPFSEHLINVWDFPSTASTFTTHITDTNHRTGPWAKTAGIAVFSLTYYLERPRMAQIVPFSLRLASFNRLK